MKSYIMKVKKNWFWQSYRVVGHNLNIELNRMDLFFEDGSLKSLAEWSKYDIELGVDWVLFTKKQMETEAGQPVQLRV